MKKGSKINLIIIIVLFIIILCLALPIVLDIIGVGDDAAGESSISLDNQINTLPE